MFIIIGILALVGFAAIGGFKLVWELMKLLLVIGFAGAVLIIMGVL